MTAVGQISIFSQTSLEQHSQATKDTFAASIQSPKAAYLPANDLSLEHASHAVNKQQETYLDRASPDWSSTTYKTSSGSSTDSSSVMTIRSSIDLEKGLTQEQQVPSTRRSDNRDLEKVTRGSQRRPDGLRRVPTTINYPYTEGDEAVTLRAQETKALNILLFLAGPCVALSLLNAVWTFISITITFLTQPVRLCTRRSSFGLQLAGLLGPALNLQLRSIYTPPPSQLDEDTSYHVFQLITVLLLSPFISLGMMLVSWVVAVYWASSLVVDDPAGLDKQDDGRDTVLALCKWWERWLMRSVKE